MLFDFKKSYDMSWKFIFKTLEYFIFGKKKSGTALIDFLFIT